MLLRRLQNSIYVESQVAQNNRLLIIPQSSPKSKVAPNDGVLAFQVGGRTDQLRFKKHTAPRLDAFVDYATWDKVPNSVEARLSNELILDRPWN